MNESNIRELIKYSCLEIGENYHKSNIEDLMYGIVAHETWGLKTKWQGNFSPASTGGGRGAGQMEAKTGEFVCNYIFRKGGPLKKAYNKWRNKSLSMSENLMSDDVFHFIMMRSFLWTIPEKIPAREDFNSAEEYVAALAKYWKIYWNTVDGAGEEPEFVRNYNR